MILLDLNGVLLANLMQQICSAPNEELSEGLIRHMVLTSLLSIRRRFKHDYGQLVLCADAKWYWRKKVFPHYKQNRKKNREKSQFDWALIFSTMNKMREELKENFPYRLMDIEGAEADDIIAVLAEWSQSNMVQVGLRMAPEPVLIISGDKDFLQLQKYPNVKQYAPTKKEFLISKNPERDLIEKIIRGDTGDGIPNFLSDDDTFVNDEKRQKSVFEKKVMEWVDMPTDRICSDYDVKTDTWTLNKEKAQNYIRNRELISFEYIPTHIKDSILQEFHKPFTATKKNLTSYFMKNQLSSLYDSIGDF